MAGHSASEDARKRAYVPGCLDPECAIAGQASQSTLVAADMARWDVQAAAHRAATPAWAS
jgi:hypothetical protein